MPATARPRAAVPDVCIAGAGIIGLALALELDRRGLSVTVLDRSVPLAEASAAAAGMLAADDPGNPPALSPLAHLSLSLYPAFLNRIAELSSTPVPFQTRSTLQAIEPHDNSASPLSRERLRALLPQLQPSGHSFFLLDERSIDPRQLAAALLRAVHSTHIQLLSHTPLLAARTTQTTVEVTTPALTINADSFVDCTGAWASSRSPLFNLTVKPIKGQMLSLALPSGLPLDLTVRTREIYILPRTCGPHAGRAVVGATVEDVGFDKAAHLADIAALHSAATRLLPEFATAARLEAWAGLRPGTSDALPILGPHPEFPRQFLATGHFRNGILLAPATACVLADLLTARPPSLDLAPFSPARALLSHNQAGIRTPSHDNASSAAL